jgi:hypothetical protein
MRGKQAFIRSFLSATARFLHKLDHISCWLPACWHVLPPTLFTKLEAFHPVLRPVMAVEGFPGEMEKFCTPVDKSDVDNPHALIYLHSSRVDKTMFLEMARWEASANVSRREKRLILSLI